MGSKLREFRTLESRTNEITGQAVSYLPMGDNPPVQIPIRSGEHADANAKRENPCGDYPKFILHFGLRHRRWFGGNRFRRDADHFLGPSGSHPCDRL
jgi:hypothetical protein